MSNVPKEAIEVIAQSIGITNLSPDVALILAPDVEYRVREIMQVIFNFPFCLFMNSNVWIIFLIQVIV